MPGPRTASKGPHLKAPRTRSRAKPNLRSPLPRTHASVSGPTCDVRLTHCARLNKKIIASVIYGRYFGICPALGTYLRFGINPAALGLAFLKGGFFTTPPNLFNRDPNLFNRQTVRASRKKKVNLFSQIKPFSFGVSPQCRCKF